ncbi:MAG: PaaI family thioesterase [Acidobacteria bacterium]|nr:PaaI family thioesterase [Acidobacteriota bacterium]
MSGEEHFKALETMYASAPCNSELGPTLRVGRGEAEVQMVARPSMHHAAHAVHGAFYFKMLDDAAFFAANSLVEDVFVVTVSLDVELFRPVQEGRLIARGRVLHAGRKLLFAESVLSDAQGRLLAKGNGVFARSGVTLDERVGYGTEPGAIEDPA